LWVRFNDPAGQPRWVGIREGERFITLWVYSNAHPQPGQVPPSVWPYLLMRNEHAPAGSWHISPAQTAPGTLYFVLRYQALAGGLDANMLNYLCQSMVREMAACENILGPSLEGKIPLAEQLQKELNAVLRQHREPRAARAPAPSVIPEIMPEELP